VVRRVEPVPVVRKLPKRTPLSVPVASEMFAVFDAMERAIDAREAGQELTRRAAERAQAVAAMDYARWLRAEQRAWAVQQAADDAEMMQVLLMLHDAVDI